jgi:hypothetical protein
MERSRLAVNKAANAAALERMQTRFELIGVVLGRSLKRVFQE